MSDLGRPSIRRTSARVPSKKRRKSSKGLKSAHQRTEQDVMVNKTGQEWDAEVARFRVCLQDAKSSDETVQAAWSRLRQSYRAAFNAIAYPHSGNKDLEPFPFWAAENIEEDILERVMRIEFSSSLATCLLSRLQTIASMSDLSIYILILYFGNSFFIKGRLLMFRKRVHNF